MAVIHQVIFIVLWIGTCGYAYVRGGVPERLVASIFIIGALASLALAPARDHIFSNIEIGIMAVDTVMLLLLGGLALFSARFWPLAMAGLQGAEVLGHLARMVAHGILPPAYFTLTVMWSFPMLILLGLGTWRHRRRLRRYGRDYAWTWELPESYRSKGVEL